MKVEKHFVVDGQVVSLTHDGKDLMIYETKDQETLFIVLKGGSEEVLTRIDISCEMSQGTGFVDSIKYKDYY